MLADGGVFLAGILLGLRHALDPDHLAAVSTIVAEKPRGLRMLSLGASWGIGHAGTLFVCGGALLVVRAPLPGWLEGLFEIAVAVMLIGLGVRGLIVAARRGAAGAKSWHTHGRSRAAHVHHGETNHVHLARWTLARRPLAVGIIHGLAGTGALSAFVMAQMPSLASGLVYMGLFGVGSIVGMAMLSGLVGAAFHRLANVPAFATGLGRVTSVASIVTGMIWGIRLL